MVNFHFRNISRVPFQHNLDVQICSPIKINNDYANQIIFQTLWVCSRKIIDEMKNFQVKFPKKSFSSIKKTTDTEHRVTHWEFVLFYAGIYKTMLYLSVFALGLHTVLLIVKKHEANCFCCVFVKLFKSFLQWKLLEICR